MNKYLNNKSHRTFSCTSFVDCKEIIKNINSNNNNNKNNINIQNVEINSDSSNNSSPSSSSDNDDGNVDSGTKYLCNVGDQFNSTETCQPFTTSSNIRGCNNLNDCITAISTLPIKTVDILNINIFNTSYSGPENCNLKFNLPCQVVIAPDKSASPPQIDCIGQPSFISHLLSTTLIDSLTIMNAYDSCINVPANPNSLVLMISNSNFRNCSGQNGGAIQMTYPNSLVIRNSEFESNSAVHSGGAVYSDATTITNCSFLTNSADRGGAIYSPVQTSSELVVRQSVLKFNVAAYGGAIYTSEFQTTYSTYRGNFASEVGGAIYSATIMTNECEFSLNNARVSGGAIALDHAFRQNLVIATNIFNNTADYSGGAFYINEPSSNKSSLTFVTSNVFYNSAINGPGGGAFLNQTFNGYLISGSFYDNYSPYNESHEIGCDEACEGYSCNFCVTDSCTACTTINGICLNQNNQSMCMVSTHQCVHGACSINVNSTYTCSCSHGYTGDTCNQVIIPTTTPTPTKTDDSSRLKTLDIALPIAFGCLIALFIVTLIIMIKRKDRVSGYEIIT